MRGSYGSWAIVIVLTIGAAPAAAQLFSPTPVAVVNGEPVPRAALDEILKSRPAAVTPLTAAQQRQIKEEIVSVLIDELLVRQFLKKNAPPVEPAEVSKQYAMLEKGLTGQGKSISDYLKETKQTEAQVKANITAMLQWTGYAAKTVTDDVLQRYHAENKDFFDKTTVRANHIVLRVLSDASQAERDEMKSKLASIRAEIAAGKVPFSEAAIRHSQCPSAPKGGDLGFFARKWMVEEPFAKAAFAMKPGELSDIVMTDYGLHLIQVTERKLGEPTTFESAKDEVRDCFIEDMKQRIITDLRKSAKIEVKLP